jgi:hypothetical protein
MGVNGKETAESGKVLRVVENTAAVIPPGTAVRPCEDREIFTNGAQGFGDSGVFSSDGGATAASFA